jgi:hypothetical protein
MTNALKKAYRGSSWLTVMAAAMGVLAIAAAIALPLDHRTVLGQPVWLKPLKFGVSFAVYAITLAWLLGHVPATRMKKAAVALVVVGSYVEVTLIVTQAARGRTSHFNEATALDAGIWQAMGIMAALFGIGTAIVAILVWRAEARGTATQEASKLGLLLLLAGMGQAALMVTAMRHAVGVPDGGPGLPLTGWSTTGGDLRVGHFVGVHGLQAMILLAMLVPARPRLIRVAAGAYAGLLVLVTWQALRGQPLTQPDAVTLAAAGVLAVATATAVVRYR